MFEGIPRPVEPLTDTDLERAALALVFADNANFDKLDNLQPDDFSDVFLANAYRVALDVRADGSPVNLITVKHRLDGMRLPGFDEGTGLDALRRLSIGESLPSAGDVAARLRMLAQRRLLVQQLGDLREAAADEGQAISSVASTAIGRLNEFVAEAAASECTSFAMAPSAEEFIEWLQSGDDPVEIPTGLADLDAATGGWHRGEFVILAGRPSMGKSAIALASALRTAKKGYGVLFFSLEMTKRQIVARALADFAYDRDKPLHYSNLKPRLVTSEQVARLYTTAEQFKDLPIEFETRAGLTVGEIMARTRKAVDDFKAQGKELALVVIDHLLKIKPSKRYAGQPVQELTEISDGCCLLAKTLNVAVLALHQLNRQVEGRDNQRPLMSDLRGSGSLEQDADAVLFAYRPAYVFERQMQEGDENKAAAEKKIAMCRHDLEIQIAKQRNGATKTLEFFVDIAANVVRDKDKRPSFIVERADLR
jgi:replicative DNA helicase